MTTAKFQTIRLEQDIGNDVNVILNGELLKNGQSVEIKWENDVISDHHIYLNCNSLTNSAHNDNWVVKHYKPYIKIVHNDTIICVSALGLKARRL